jgi:hypothetical protein
MEETMQVLTLTGLMRLARKELCSLAAKRRQARQKRRDDEIREARWQRQKERDEDLALLWPTIIHWPKFSKLTLAANAAACGNRRLPALTGTATVLDIDGRPVEFNVAAWGPTKPEGGRRPFYNVTLKPKELELLPLRPIAQAAGVLNQPTRFELKKVGTGRIFERGDAEIDYARRSGKKLPRFSGYGLVLLPSGPAYLDLSVWPQEPGIYSGNAPLHDQAAIDARAAKSAARLRPSLAQPSTTRRALLRTAEPRRSPQRPYRQAGASPMAPPA